MSSGLSWTGDPSLSGLLHSLALDCTPFRYCMMQTHLYKLNYCGVTSVLDGVSCVNPFFPDSCIERVRVPAYPRPSAPCPRARARASGSAGRNLTSTSATSVSLDSLL